MKKYFWDADWLNGYVRRLLIRTQGRKKGWPLIRVDEDGRVVAGSGFNVIYGFKTEKAARKWVRERQREDIRCATARLRKPIRKVTR